MTGSLQVKNGKFYIIINTHDEYGKRKPKWIATGLVEKGNKKRAEQLLRDTIREYELRENLVNTDTLFSDAIRQWLESVSLRIDATTYQGYEILARTHILPYFEKLKIKLVDVDRHVLQKYIDTKYKNGRLDGKGGLSARSIRLHKNIIFQTLSNAVLDKLIPFNPCERITLPPLVKYKSKFYSQEQVVKLLDAIKDEPLYPLLTFTAIYGLRRSEVLGLTWSGISFDNNTVTISRTITKVTKIIEKEKTKNASSHRSFPLLPELREMLLELKRNESENIKLLGKSYIRNDYIFKWSDGHPFSPDFVSQRFSRLLEVHGMEHIRFHELRHSCASILLNMGYTLKDVQEWMGHADIKVTADIYGHIDVARKRNMAVSLGSSLAAQQ